MEGMTGREYYSYKSRKEELLTIFIELGGEAQWKTLAKRVKWGPNTLKKVLDNMIKEHILNKTARLTGRGSDVWYVISDIEWRKYIPKELLEFTTSGYPLLEIATRARKISGTYSDNDWARQDIGIYNGSTAS
jgi:hypothetical protein